MSMCTDLSNEIVRASLVTPTTRREWAVSRVVNKFRCGRKSPEESTTKKNAGPLWDHYVPSECRENTPNKANARKRNTSTESARAGQ